MFFMDSLSNLYLAQVDFALANLANPTVIIVGVIIMTIAGIFYFKNGSASPTEDLVSKMQTLQGQAIDVGNVALEKVDDVLGRVIK